MKNRDVVIILVLLIFAGIAFVWYQKLQADKAKAASGGVFGTAQVVAGGAFNTVGNVASGALGTATGIVKGTSGLINAGISGVTSGLSKAMPWNLL